MILECYVASSITDTEKIAFIQRVLGQTSVSRDGRNVAVACPSCRDAEKKKLAIRLDDWQFHCWVCGEKGRTLVPLLRKHSLPEVLSFYREKFLGQVLAHTQAPGEIEDEPLALPEGFILLAEATERKDPDVRAALSYLSRRGVDLDLMWRFKLGLCSSGRFRRRIIMPSFDEHGDLNYFVARTIDSVTPKYLNCNANKRRMIFNDISIDWDKPVTVCEGPFDLMKCDRNTTCLLGSSLSEDSLLFKKIVANETPVILALDADMQKKTQQFASTLSSYGCDVKILDLCGKKDVGEMTTSEFVSAKDSANAWKQKDYMIFKIGLIRSASLL